MNFFKATAAAFVATAALGASANAATMTFNGSDGDGSFTIYDPGDSYSEDGYTLTMQSGRGYTIDNDFDATLAGFDDDVFEFDTTGTSALLTADSGNTFDVISMVVGALQEDAQLRFEGTFSNGIKIVAAVDVFAGNTDLYLFSAGFSDLVSLRIFADIDGHFPVFDDIVLRERLPDVPLPAALPLFLAGLAGFGAAARKRKSVA